jgi:RNA-binding protein 4
MVKIFIGNIAQEAEKDELEALFTPYGQVTECAKYKNYAFVHMDDRKSATKAIRELHGHKLHGRPINVEPSRGKNNGPVKLHIANVEKGHDDELRALFEEYGDVSECAIIKNFAFVHMDDRKAAVKAIKTLHLHKLHGSQINVEASHGKNQGAVKLHVANVDKGDDGELRTLFEEYGSVSECAVVKNFAFVHMCNSEEAMDAIKGLDNTEFQGKGDMDATK